MYKKASKVSKADGTFLRTTVLTTYDELESLFGAPNEANEWVLENVTGECVTVYAPTKESTLWSIGAKTMAKAYDLLELLYIDR